MACHGAQSHPPLRLTALLTLGAGLIGINLARQIVKTWLTTEFGGGRHAPRVEKIMAVEKQYLK